MPTIRLITEARAPIQRCFDLARSVDFHVDSMQHSGERAVAGITRGLLSLDDQVTWEARHLGIRQRLTSRITAFDPPNLFVDEMVTGAFHSFRHEHRFEALAPNLTRITDTFEFRSPVGPLGHVANALFLTRYMRQQLTIRGRALRTALESDHWRRFLRADDGT